MVQCVQVFSAKPYLKQKCSFYTLNSLTVSGHLTELSFLLGVGSSIAVSENGLEYQKVQYYCSNLHS